MRTSIIIACVGLALWTAPGAASAKTINTRFETDLDACCDAPSENNGGKADYKLQTAKGATKQEVFRTIVHVELPSTVLGLNDASDAQAADVRVILSRTATPYAECSLVFTEIQQETEIEDGEPVTTNEASFFVDVRNLLKKGSLQLATPIGTCDVDLGTAGVQGGVPAVQAGDTATVVLVDPSEASSPPASRTLDDTFLQGTF
ncbi:MAG TPA: hypothetical protein VHL99_02000 [Candidatus Binatia bacterium]|jgi:hypothetical protein|nr:hypothetical protein [Candidatus Binatia bacterium]